MPVAGPVGLGAAAAAKARMATRIIGVLTPTGTRPTPTTDRADLESAMKGDRRSVEQAIQDR